MHAAWGHDVVILSVIVIVIEGDQGRQIAFRGAANFRSVQHPCAPRAATLRCREGRRRCACVATAHLGWQEQNF